MLGMSLSAQFGRQRENWCQSSLTALLFSPVTKFCWERQQACSDDGGKLGLGQNTWRDLAFLSAGDKQEQARQCVGLGWLHGLLCWAGCRGRVGAGTPLLRQQQRADTYGTPAASRQLKTFNWSLSEMREKPQTPKREAKKEKPLPKQKLRSQRGKTHAATEHAWLARADFKSGRNHTTTPFPTPTPLHFPAAGS